MNQPIDNVQHQRHIVVVGGGFAGASLVRSLQHRLPAGWRIVLISEESYTTFNPMLAEVVGASIFPEHVVAPLRELVAVAEGHQFIMGTIIAADTSAKTITCQTLAGDITLAYEHVVFAFGNRARLDFIQGMAEHSLPLKTIGDALEIRNAVLRCLAQAELEADPVQRRRLAHFTVIGGGFSGVEVAGELIDCLRSIQRYYPRVAAAELAVTLVHDSQQLLPELPQAMGLATKSSLEQRGVRVMLGERAVAIHADGVTLDSGMQLIAATVVCTIGTRPNSLVAALGLPQDRGRILVEADMAVAGREGLWALGDCALVPNARTGTASPPTAQFAVRQAQLLAKNILCAILQKPTQPFNYQARGSMAAIGHMKGVAALPGLHLSGLPAWLLWRAYYLSQMPTFGRKLRIFVEWTWGMFFPADITHFRFSRSQDRDGPQSERAL
jgi:NADH:ubiquinone reductase (H+-translocating)